MVCKSANPVPKESIDVPTTQFCLNSSCRIASSRLLRQLRFDSRSGTSIKVKHRHFEWKNSKTLDFLERIFWADFTGFLAMTSGCLDSCVHSSSAALWLDVVFLQHVVLFSHWSACRMRVVHHAYVVCMSGQLHRLHF